MESKPIYGSEPTYIAEPPHAQIPPRVKDRRGCRYGRLEVVSLSHIRKRIAYWLCKCDCGNETIVSSISLRTGNTKSCGCLAVEVRKRQYSSVVTHCDFCGKEIRVKKSQYDRTSHHYCDSVCMGKHRVILFSGVGNHQYGLRGRLNASFTSDEMPRKNNGLTDRMVYVGDWHKGSINGRVKRHRFLVEQNYQMFNPDFFEEIDGWHYLRKGIEVHHKDFDHDNNSIENLVPLTKSQHRSLHNIIRNKTKKRDANGRFAAEPK